MSDKETIENLQKIQQNQRRTIGLIVVIVIGGLLFYLNDKQKKEAQAEADRIERDKEQLMEMFRSLPVGK